MPDPDQPVTFLTGSLTEGLPDGPEPNERFEDLVARPGVRVERIVSTGQTAPESGWFDQVHDEWVCVIDGEARLAIEGQGDHLLSPGDWMLIPRHCRHRVIYTRAAPPTVWLAVHMDAPPDA